jgi:hypothetical protein
MLKKQFYHLIVYKIIKQLPMKKYWTALFLVSLVLMILGFASGKITGDSFSYISVTGFLFAILKILIVTITISLAATITIPAIFIDLVMMIFGSYSFTLTPAIWTVVWDEYTMTWFWGSTSGSSLLFATIILVVLTGLLFRKS